MIDVLTVATKEWKELVWSGGGMRGGRMSLVILLAVFGVFMPYQFGAEWLHSPGMLMYWAWVPLMIVSGVVADAFAGERERHTLETLLATRLPDRAILFGKTLAAVGYGWGLVLAMLALGVVTVAVTDRASRLPLVPTGMMVWAPVLALLGATIAAGAGILVSLRAPTVKQAAQTLNVAILLLVFVPVIAVQSLPVIWRAELALWGRRVGPDGVVWVAFLVLAVVACVLLAAADVRFRRSRLTLD